MLYSFRSDSVVNSVPPYCSAAHYCMSLSEICFNQPTILSYNYPDTQSSNICEYNGSSSCCLFTVRIGDFLNLFFIFLILNAESISYVAASCSEGPMFKSVFSDRLTGLRLFWFFFSLFKQMMR